MMRQRTRLAGLALAGLLVFVFSWAGAAREAAALGDVCKDAPAPIQPKAGFAGLLTTAPKEVPAADANPFADPKIQVGDVYGYGWGWANFDLGCGNDFLRDPAAVTDTQTANFVGNLAGGLVAALDSIEQMAKFSDLGWLTRVITDAATSLRAVILGGTTAQGVAMLGLLPMAVVAAGVYMAYRAKKASYHEVGRAAGIIVLAAALSVFTLVFTATASKTVDQAVVFTSEVTGKTFNTSLTDSVNRQAPYRAWLSGYFGDPDSQMAKDLGPRLMAATHYTWSEWQTIERDPGQRAGIDKRKADEFKDIAGQVKKDSPAAYEHFTGRAASRSGPAIFGLVAAAIMALFPLVAFAMLLVARVIMQALVLVTPVALVAGVLPPGYGVLAKVWDRFTAAFLATAKFGLAAGVMSLVLGSLATIPGSSGLIWMIIATCVAFAVTKPAHSFKTFTPGLDPNRSYIKEAVGAVSGAMTGLAATDALMNSDKDETNETDTDGEKDSGSRTRPNPVEVNRLDTSSQPELPAPNFEEVPQRQALGTGADLEPGEVTRGAHTQPGTRRLQLLAAPDSGTTASADRQQDDTRAAGKETPGSADTAADTGSSSSVSSDRSTVTGESEVIVPSGVIVQTEDSTLYLPNRDRGDGGHAGQESDGETVMVPDSEPEVELDSDGVEKGLVLYRPERAA